MVEQVAAFTDTYLPTVNGVTYTLRRWRDRWHRLGGRMDVVFPESTYAAERFEHPVRSIRFPWYDGYRLGEPRIPASLSSVDLVHAHTPFAVGLAALRLSRRRELPLVASYHTPAAEYASYVAPTDRFARCVRHVARSYERRFYDRADLVITPTVTARQHVLDTVGVSTPVRVVGNGVDLERFHPVDDAALRERYGLERATTLIGYTGRHGYEKNLEELVEAVAFLGRTDGTEGDPVTLVFGGDGPARESLERRAAALGVDARFLGFLDREELPAFYSALDVFAFPSPVETQGVVALESIACGTPVVAVDAGALAETVVGGRTGYHYRPGDLRGFRRAIARTLAERATLERECLAHREGMGVTTTIERLRTVYASLGGT